MILGEVAGGQPAGGDLAQGGAVGAADVLRHPAARVEGGTPAGCS